MKNITENRNNNDDIRDTILCLFIGFLMALAFIATMLGDGRYGLIDLI
jgi:hypothetical protein